MTAARGLLSAYDDQLRTDAETGGAFRSPGWGPLRLCSFPSGRASSPTETSVEIRAMSAMQDESPDW